MSILPVVTAAGYSRTYDWLWIGIANDLVRERERTKATDENEQKWLPKQKATTGGRRKIMLEFRPTSLSLYKTASQNIRIIGFEYTRRRKEKPRGQERPPLTNRVKRAR